MLGLELSSNSPENPPITSRRAAESDVSRNEIDPDLAAVVAAWPKLPGESKLEILAILRKALEGRTPTK